jgi:hypothetical protein
MALKGRKEEEEDRKEETNREREKEINKGQIGSGLPGLRIHG